MQSEIINFAFSTICAAINSNKQKVGFYMSIVRWFESVLLIFSLLFTSITGFFNGTN